jgi:predicted RNase H-like HicB family nuclease
MISMDYLVVIERAMRGYGAYVPDLPGVGAAGRTLPEVRRLIRRAIELHVTGLREDKLSLPRPRARSEWVGVPGRTPRCHPPGVGARRAVNGGRPRTARP